MQTSPPLQSVFVAQAPWHRPLMQVWVALQSVACTQPFAGAAVGTQLDPSQLAPVPQA